VWHFYFREGMQVQYKDRSRYRWFLFFSAGLAAGAAFGAFFLNADMSEDSAVMHYIENIFSAGGQDMGRFIRICAGRLFFAAALTGLVMVMHTRMSFYMLTVMLGGAFGYVMAVLSLQYSFMGGLAMMALLLPQYLFYIPVYIIFIKLMDAKVLSRSKSPACQGSGRLAGILAAAVFILVFAGSMMESYVNPYFIKIFLKIS